MVVFSFVSFLFFLFYLFIFDTVLVNTGVWITF